ncbi:hypothetical protein RQP46_009216 [Phenoliferia psychrophenolica]
MNAVVVEQPGQVAVKQVPIPSLEAGEILVKTHAVALNPTDWKHRDFAAPAGSILGCDFSGVVSKVGASLTEVKVGDRVAGFAHGGNDSTQGAFAEYVKTEASVVWAVPEATSNEEAAAMGGVGTATAYLVLYGELNLAKPTAPVQKAEPFLVWGGATSVGLYAIQLAKMSGYTVIATCSPKNFDLVKSYGADAAYAYADADTPAKISAAYPTLALALDGISENGTTPLVARSLGASATGRRIVKLLMPAEGDNAGLEDIKISMVLAYCLLGKSFKKFGMDFAAQPTLLDGFVEWNKLMPTLVKAGLKSNPLWVQEGGLEKVNEGMELLKENKVSGQKVVFKIC